METPFEPNEYKPFVCSYPYAGSRWSVTLYARSFEDAAARLSALQMGQVDGVLVTEIPVITGWVAKVIARLRNKLVMRS